jgi:hypothetical protein
MQSPSFSQLPTKLVRKGKRLLRHSTEDISRLLMANFQNRIITNEKELRIIGLRRTGNHTVAEWIKAQQFGKIEHLNNLDVRCNPYRYKYEHLVDYYPEHRKWADNHYLPLSKGDFGQFDCLICGYEDHTLSSICDPLSEKFHDIYFGKSKERFDLLILRDPFNLFASRFKGGMIDVKSKRLTAVDLWIQYAKEFLGETNHLNQKKILINYNQWVSDIDYRKKLSLRLGLLFSDTGLRKVASLGGGSSFDGQAMNGRGNQMSVLERWKHFQHNETYRAIFQNQSLIHYARTIFGEIPGTEILL